MREESARIQNGEGGKPPWALEPVLGLQSQAVLERNIKKMAARAD